MELKRGTQIIYIPPHAHGDLKHPDVETGFVTSVKEGLAFCRYWNKEVKGELRSTVSEPTPVKSLIVKDTVPQKKSIHY